MWKMLPIILLVSYAVIEQTATAADEVPATGSRIVNSMDLALDPSSKNDPDQGVGRVFQGTETRGSIGETGAWNLSTGVTHNRLRCATYETGIQLGKGNPACTQVEWLTDISYGSSRRHCNSAVMIHKGSGKVTGGNDIYQASSCVRVVTKCTGTC
jgi:hypothetical protein